YGRNVVRHRRVVDRGGVAGNPLETEGAVVGVGDAVAPPLDRGRDRKARLGDERAGGPFDGGDVGDDVGGGAGVELADRDHRRVGRVDLPADELLEAQDR